MTFWERGEVFQDSERHWTIKSSFPSMVLLEGRTVLSYLFVPPPHLQYPCPSPNSVLTLSLLEPSPHLPLIYPEPCLPLHLLVCGDLRCSLVLQAPGPSKSHVRREERRRVTFVGIFNSGEKQTNCTRVKCQRPLSILQGREGHFLMGPDSSVSLSRCAWEIQLCPKPARKAKWMVFVNVQVHPAAGRLGSPQVRTLTHHPSSIRSSREHLLSTCYG